VYCTHCGTERAAGATVCANCGQQAQVFPPPPLIPNYLVQSILVTLCCCLPVGVVALVYAAQVNSKLAAGDVAGARAASASARTWCIVALIAGIVTGAGAALLSLL
jgi:hypothetical protein